MARIPLLRRKDATATKQQTGTSLKAQGAAAPEAANFTEIGSTAKGTLVDPVPELGNPVAAARTYRKMVRTDVSVRTSLRAGKAPVLGGEFFSEPYDNEPENLAINEFVEFNLFQAMSTPFITTLEQILKMYEDGCSVFEPVWEIREWAPKKNAPGANRRQYTTLRKLAFRPRETIIKFEYDDNGGPLLVKHNKIDAKGNAKEVEIPIEKLVVFSFDRDGGNLEGNSILRSAYEHWFYKYHLYKIDGIQKERHGIGVPEVELQPGYAPADVALAHELVKNLRTNEEAGIVRTTLMKIGFAKVDTQMVDVLKSAVHHDNMIMKNVMVQFLNLGVDAGSGGGRATGATGMDMMLKSMKFIAQSICDSLNLYLIPKLVAYNFQTDKFPKLQVRGIGETKDMQMWSAAVRNLADAGAITFDDPTEQWMRAQMDMPLKREPRPKLVIPAAGTKEIIQGSLDRGNSSTAGQTDVATGKSSTDKSNNGGAGNVGPSPNATGL